MFPSQIKYLEKNPVVSFHVNREEQEKLKELSKKRGKSLSQILREVLLGVAEKDSESYDRGYSNAMDDYSVQYPCCVCGQSILIDPDDKDDMAVIEKAFKDYGHPKCIAKAKEGLEWNE